MNRPVGRIDYLDMKGKVAEKCYYYTEKEFLDRVMEANYYGANMVVNVFKDQNGNTISLDFVTDFDPPPAGFKILDYLEGHDRITTIKRNGQALQRAVQAR